MGAGFFPIYPIMTAIVIKRSTVEHSDNNLSLFNAATDLGFLVGPVVFGLVIKYLGYVWFFIGAAIVVLMARLAWGAVREVTR
jgi:predicted MFS family arabinose efflux permease